jgi:predicted RNA methylase
MSHTQRHTKTTPASLLALRGAHTALIDEIEAGPLTTTRLSQIMSEAFGGTDASGAWEWRLAFDLMQASGLQAVLRGMERAGRAHVATDLTREIAERLPTETRRSERQMQLQQFSTAMEWGWAVALAADVRAGDVVLEPSAGVGCLAALTAASCGSKPVEQPRVILNEIDPTRRALLSLVTGQTALPHDAEFIDDLLPRDVQPSVVVMNPPFASSASRSGDATIALRHVLSAAKRLAPGGRLVAIVPPSVSPLRGGALWGRLMEEVTPLMRATLPRDAFAKMGTSVETHILIADKLSADQAQEAPAMIRASLSAPDQAQEVICTQLLMRKPIAPTVSAGDPAPKAKAPVIPPACLPRLMGQIGQASPAKARSEASEGHGTTSAASAASRRPSPLDTAGSARATGPMVDGSAASPTSTASPTIAPGPRKMVLPGRSAALGAKLASTTAMVSLKVSVFVQPKANEAVSDVYARYAPQRIEIEGAQAHPTTLVESLAMASIAPPCPLADVIDLQLPEQVIREGLLSDAQLETLLMAESAFAHDLPGRFIENEQNRLVRADEGDAARSYRKGYFLGDGTGCGKGRQVAGLILTGWAAGRRKALWVSKSAALIHDAKRDWTDLGGAPTDIHALSKWTADELIKLTEGILFVTYATLRAVSQKGKTRLEQVLDWLGEDYEGVIAFDEAHAMQNAGGSGSARGASGPSQQGLAGLRLQNALPRARVLYVSATGATEVANLAYATRLGLWGAGEGYAFPSRESFVEAMEAGGVAAMEVVARDLKALGLYTARALSFEGVEYDVLEHRLTEDQVTAYDAWARAFKVIHGNLHKALEATGVTKSEGGSSEAGSGSAKAAAISAFETTKQRFFGHLLLSMKARSVIAAIETDIAEGWAPVVQIVSTGEALLNRRLEALAPEEELSEASLSPREYVLGYLQNAFPVLQMQLIEQEDGTTLAEPLRNADGTPVISREAEKLRDRMIENLLLLPSLPTALDQIIWGLGAERVAEVTGRSGRPIKTQDGRLKIERRAASANVAESEAFMAGTKDVLIFSDAGGTGRSYQAAKTAANQKRRRHYLLEPGWRADNAIQGLGRTHRSAQVSAPFFRVCTTDVHGEKRFTSTIARRLDTLGALTKGQRETASQGMFRAEDNLESPIARGCLRGLYRDITFGREAVMPLETFEDWTGLRLTNNEGQLLDDLPPIQRFLNRILALPIAMQNAIFADFMERIATTTERARAAGTLDIGLEQLRGEKITAGAPEALCTDEATGAVTSLVPITVENRLSYYSGAEARDAYERYKPMQNISSGKVALIAPAPRSAFDEIGDLVEERRVIRPMGSSWINEVQYGKSQWEAVSVERFARLWDAEVAKLPDWDVQNIYLLTGLILPIWRSIPGTSTRIYRAKCDDGATYLGRALNGYEAGLLRGRYMQVDTADPASIYEAVVEGQNAIEIISGLTLTERRVAGHKRLEITGADRATLDWLRTLGCFTEIHQFALRVFIPHGDRAASLAVIAAILGRKSGENVAVTSEQDMAA